MVRPDCHILTPYFNSLHQSKTPASFTKNCHPKSYFFSTLSTILEIFHSKTPNRLEFEKKVPKCPFFMRLSLKDPLFLPCMHVFEGNVAPSNKVRSWKILYYIPETESCNLVNIFRCNFSSTGSTDPIVYYGWTSSEGRDDTTDHIIPLVKHGRGYILQPSSIWFCTSWLS